MSRYRRVILAFLAAMAVALAVTSSAPAASGGGCRGAGAVVRACISYSGAARAVIADFYHDRNADYSRCRAQLTVFTRDPSTRESSVATKWFTLSRGGRYGEIRVPLPNTMPLPRAGYYQSYSAVDVYTCNGRLHYRMTSPTQYWP